MLLKNVFEIELMRFDNNRQTLKDLNRKIEQAACRFFDGCTLLNSKGYWLDGGRLYKDNSYRMLINFNTDKQTLDKLLSLIEMELIEGKQETVYFSVNGITSISGNLEEARHDLVEMLKKESWY